MLKTLRRKRARRAAERLTLFEAMHAYYRTDDATTSEALARRIAADPDTQPQAAATWRMRADVAGRGRKMHYLVASVTSIDGVPADLVAEINDAGDTVVGEGTQ